MKYIGIIDDYGLESFKKNDVQTLTWLKIRAMLNLQRNALVYEVEMSFEEGKLFLLNMQVEENWKQHAKELQEMESFKWVK